MSRPAKAGKPTDSFPIDVEARDGASGFTSIVASENRRREMTKTFLEVDMKRVLSCGALALLLLVPAADASAQKLSGFIALGPTTTTGDLKDADSTKSGFAVQGGFEYKLSAPLWLRVDASMGWNDRLTNFAEDAYIWTFAGRAEYWLPLGSDKLRPYVLAGVGMMLYKRNPGETGREDTPEYETKNRTLISGGAGLDWQIGGTSIFVEGRYDMGADNRSMIPLMLGARWGARQ